MEPEHVAYPRPEPPSREVVGTKADRILSRIRALAALVQFGQSLPEILQGHRSPLYVVLWLAGLLFLLTLTLFTYSGRRWAFGIFAFLDLAPIYAVYRYWGTPYVATWGLLTWVIFALQTGFGVYALLRASRLIAGR